MHRTSPTLLWLTLAGCTMLPGRPLESVTPPHGSTVEVFEAARCDDDSHSLASLRRTLDHWRTPIRGRPRFEGILRPNDPTLYDAIIAHIDAGAPRIALHSEEFARVGWDGLSTVWYVADDPNAPLGRDETLEGAAEPAPPSTPEWVGYDGLTWWSLAQYPLHLAIHSLIGLKNAAFEVVKVPLTGLEMLTLPSLLPPHAPWVAPSVERAGAAMAEDVRHAALAIGWHVMVGHADTPLDLVRDLLTAAPLLGPVILAIWPRRPLAPTSNPVPDDTMIAVSQGIYARGPDAQLVTGLARQLESLRPASIVKVVPNVHSGIFDVLFSLLNLSQGYAYDAAARIRGGLDGTNTVELVGFSGGAQRMLVAGHLLNGAGVTVRRLTGIAGPTFGPAPTSDAVVFLGDAMRPDPVVASARIVGLASGLAPGSPIRVDVHGGGNHHVPYFPDSRTRAPNAAYAEKLDARFGGPQ